MLPAHEIPAHMKEKAQIKQVYVPKKEEVTIISTQEVGPPAFITIGFAQVPIVKINKLIVIEEPTA
jgi:hypothetical protein